MRTYTRIGLAGTVGVLAFLNAATCLADRYASAEGAWLVPQSNGVPTPNFCTNWETPCPGLEFALLLAQPGETVFVIGDMDVQEMSVKKPVTIEADGSNLSPPRLTSATGRHFKVFERGELTLIGLELTGGTAALGGSIYTAGALSLENTVLKANSASQSGGGIYAAKSAFVTLLDSVILQNSATDGGGIFADGAQVDVTHSTIAQHEIGGNGGALYALDGAVVNLHEVTLEANAAHSGGAVYMEDSVLTSELSLVDRNRAYLTGGGIVASGDSVLTVVDTAITSNNAEASAGFANSNVGGGIHAPANANVLVTGGVLADNHAYRGGGIFASGNHVLSILESTVHANGADNRGGALWLDGGTAILINDTLDENRADSAGAIYSGDDLHVEHCTFVANAADTGPTLWSIQQATVLKSIIDASENLAGIPSQACAGIHSLGQNNLVGADNIPFDSTCGDDPSGAFNLGRVTSLGAVATLSDGTRFYQFASLSNAHDAAGGCGVPRDQIGTPRDDGACDIGSIEFH